MRNTLIVNLFAGPGAGKSTIAAGVFSALKNHGVCCELVTEFAKELAWNGTLDQLQDDPVWGFGNQHKRISQVVGKVDVIITDSPLLMTMVYQKCSPELENLIVAEHRRWPTINFFVKRQKGYVPIGRRQTEQEAIDLDHGTHLCLMAYRVPFLSILGNENAVPTIVDTVLSIISKENCCGTEYCPRTAC